MIYNVVIEPRAILDIQDAINYYDSKRVGLGEHFYEIVDEYLNILAKNPFLKLDIRIIALFPLENFHLLSFTLLMKKLKRYIL